MHLLSGTGGSAAFEASDLSVLPPFFFFWGPLNPILYNSFVFPAPHEPSSQIFVLGLSEFLLSMKEAGHRKRENLFYPGFCCSGHGPSARMQSGTACSRNKLKENQVFSPFPAHSLLNSLVCLDKKEWLISSVCNSTRTWFYSRPQATEKSKHWKCPRPYRVKVYI